MKRLTTQNLEDALLNAPGLSSSYRVSSVLGREDTKRLLKRVRCTLIKARVPRDELDDWVQIVFLEVMRSLPRFRGDSSFATFVGGITQHVMRRSRRRSAWQKRAVPLEVEQIDQQRPSPEEQLYLKEQLRRAQGALGRLSPQKREAFTEWAFEGKTPSKIASESKASLAATRSRIFYAQKELKARALRDEYLSDWVGARTRP